MPIFNTTRKFQQIAMQMCIPALLEDSKECLPGPDLRLEGSVLYNPPTDAPARCNATLMHVRFHPLSRKRQGLVFRFDLHLQTASVKAHFISGSQ
jgi:hypothetical protein